MSAKKGYTKLSYDRVVVIGMAIKAHCHLVDGYAEYDHGYSDASIAKFYDLPPDSSHVTGLRQKLIGTFRPVGGRDTTKSQAYKTLEARITRIEEALGMNK